jgi:hypothetical protein
MNELASTKSVGLPADLDLPFFTYGLFKHDEFAYDQIREFVTSVDGAVLPGSAIRIRDGLPVLDPNVAATGVHGDLVVFGDARAAYERISEFEPRKLYHWRSRIATVTVNGESVKANVLDGTSPEKGSEPTDLSTWSSAQDPVLVWGLPAVRRQALLCARDQFQPFDPSNMKMWAPRFFDVQATYLLATSILERLATFVCGPLLGPTSLVAAFGESPGFARVIESASLIPHPVRSSNSPAQRASRDVVESWYWVRSNLLHRGKAAFRDAELVRVCLIELHDALRQYLLDRCPALADEWIAIEGVSTESWLLAPEVEPQLDLAR